MKAKENQEQKNLWIFLYKKDKEIVMQTYNSPLSFDLFFTMRNRAKTLIIY